MPPHLTAVLDGASVGVSGRCRRPGGRGAGTADWSLDTAQEGNRTPGSRDTDSRGGTSGRLYGGRRATAQIIIKKY